MMYLIPSGFQSAQLTQAQGPWSKLNIRYVTLKNKMYTDVYIYNTYVSILKQHSKRILRPICLLILAKISAKPSTTKKSQNHLLRFLSPSFASEEDREESEKQLGCGLGFGV